MLDLDYSISDDKEIFRRVFAVVDPRNERKVHKRYLEEFFSLPNFLDFDEAAKARVGSAFLRDSISQMEEDLASPLFGN